MNVRSGWRRLTRPTRVVAAIGALLLAMVILAAVFAPLLAEHAANRTSGAPYLRPSAEHWLGTDDLGRDLWAQLVHGARVSLTVGLAAAVIATVVGTTVALVAGYRGGLIDAVLMRITDLVLSLPFLVLVLVFATFFGRGTTVTIVLIAGVLWARPARLLRSQVLKVRELDHVVSAATMGATTPRILARHVLPRLAPLLSSQFVRAASVAVVVQSGVAFLGLGDPGRVSWGATLFFANNASAILTDAWRWWIVPPGVALCVLIVGLAFVGYAVEEWADPRLRTGGPRPGVRRRLDPEPPRPAAEEARLEIRGLTVRYGSGPDPVTAVDDIDLVVGRGRVLGVVGESGSGKSSLVLAVTGMLRPPGQVVKGQIMMGDTDLRRLGREGLTRRRGRDLALVPQAAMGLLDPTVPVHDQVAESARLVRERRPAAARATEVLDLVGIPTARHRAFPHELSGGMRQRVVIAMAIANDPVLLIADEPTTGLDVVTEAAILRLLQRLRDDLDLDVLLISHDLPLVTAIADDLAIMYGGRIVERGAVAAILDHPEHPYTRTLLQAFPPLDGPRRLPQPIPGDAPDLALVGAGCPFAGRCPEVVDVCREQHPDLLGRDEHRVACHVESVS